MCRWRLVSFRIFPEFRLLLDLVSTFSMSDLTARDRKLFENL